MNAIFNIKRNLVHHNNIKSRYHSVLAPIKEDHEIVPVTAHSPQVRAEVHLRQ